MAVPALKGALLVAVGQTYETKMTEFQVVPHVAVRGACLAGHAKHRYQRVRSGSLFLSWNCLFLKWLARSATPARMDFPETGYK